MKYQKFIFVLLLTLSLMAIATGRDAYGDDQGTVDHGEGLTILLARGTNGMQTWSFDPDNDSWKELVVSTPPWSDGLGWNYVDNYSTIQTADIDGDEIDGLLARSDGGMLTVKFNSETDTWVELFTVFPPWNNLQGWDDVDNYSTIQTADVDGDGAAELLARGTNGMQTWKFDPIGETWFELVVSSPPWSDALGWDDADNYSTIQTADVDGDGAAELLARGTNGMQTWQFQSDPLHGLNSSFHPRSGVMP